MFWVLGSLSFEICQELHNERLDQELFRDNSKIPLKLYQSSFPLRLCRSLRPSREDIAVLVGEKRLLIWWHRCLVGTVVTVEHRAHSYGASDRLDPESFGVFTAAV